MVTLYQFEIVLRQTDSTAKKKRPIMEEKFFSTDINGHPRFYTTKRAALISASFKLFDKDHADAIAFGVACLTYDKDSWQKILENITKVVENGEISANRLDEQVRHKTVSSV